MSDAPPPIPNPPVRPGALRAPDFDYSKLELHALAAMLDGDLAVLPWQQEIIDRLGREEARIAIDPASPAGDRTAVLASLYGCHTPIVIIDDFHLTIDNDLLPRDITEFDIERGERTITGRMEGLIEEDFLKALHRYKEAKPTQPAEAKPDNRKQRRIDAAKERRKPRGQRKKLIMDIETYDPNRSKDWLR